MASCHVAERLSPGLGLDGILASATLSQDLSSCQRLVRSEDGSGFGLAYCHTCLLDLYYICPMAWVVYNLALISPTSDVVPIHI